MNLRQIILIMTMFVMTPAAAYAQTANSFPNRRIHIVLPYPAGGIADVGTRIITDRLAELWGQPIVVESKPGAGGNIAWEQVSRAEPDGYTWSFMSTAVIANPRMQSSLRWSEKSFVPIGAVAWAPSVIVVSTGIPTNTMAEFIDYTRKKPGELNWVNPSIGASQHLNSVMFLGATKLQMTEIQYRGQPPAIIDLLADRVQFQVASIGLVAEHVQTGKLKALAVIGKNRSSFLPNVPTLTEAGYPEVNVVGWYGFVAPRGTPQPVVDKIVDGINTVLKDPKVRAALEAQALQPVDPMTSAQINALVDADTERYAKVITEFGIKVGN